MKRGSLVYGRFALSITIAGGTAIAALASLGFAIRLRKREFNHSVAYMLDTC